MRCMNCETKNPEGANFCLNCGRPLEAPSSLKCHACGADLPRGAGYCLACGAKVDAAGGSGRESNLESLQRAAPEDLQRRMRAASTRDEGERKPVTILFADIVGSTSIAEGLDPEEWKEIVSGVHRRVGEAVYRYEGTVAQLLGDGVLAFFGAPITHEDDPIRAVRAALDLQGSIGEFSRELSGLVDELQMRVGIHSGEVVIGEIGTDLHMEYLAIGDAVNAAARLESAAEPGSILISARCARLIGEGFSLKDLGEVEVKGKAEPIHVYEVQGMAVVPVSRRGDEAVRSAYVGRETEVEELRSMLGALTEGQGGIVALMGEAGIGKTRLLEEVRREFEVEAGPVEPDAPESPIRWLEGRALSYGGSLPYWAITQVILDDLGISEGAPALKVKVALRKRLKELFEAGEERYFPFLARLLGISEEAEFKARLDSLDAESIKAETLGALKAYLKTVAKQRPTALVMEDLHWADPSTLEVLEALMELADREALLILLLMRVDRDHGSWRLKLRAETDYPHRYSEIDLRSLEETQADDLLDQLLDGGQLSKGLRDLILARAEGNPFYLEEVVRHLIDSQLIERVNGAWRAAAAVEEAGIPETLQGVLLARIDRLEEEVRRTLQMASVIGKSFLYRILEAVAAAEHELDAHLSELQREDLVREKTRLPELEYMFKHSLTQEATYSSLLIERRREFHLKVGEAIEDLFPERSGEFLGLLAHHFEAAGEREKARDYLLKAGDQARLAYANREAIESYRRALPILNELGEDETAVKVLMKLGLTCHSAFLFEDAREAYDQAFSLSKRIGQRREPEASSPAPHPLRFHQQEIVALDPIKSTDTASWTVIQQLFRGLLRIDPELNVQPEVAESWQVLDGGRQYIFQLRQDVTWSDGMPVTAGDFEFAWKRMLEPDQPSMPARYLYDIQNARTYHQGEIRDPACLGITSENDYTLRVELEKPCSYFLHLLTVPITFPVPQHLVGEDPHGWATPGRLVGNGPFTLESLKAGEELVLRRNPDYWGDVFGNVRSVQISFSDDAWNSLDRYQDDQTDILILVPELVRDARKAYRNFSEEYLSYPALSTSYIAFNVRTRPFDDPRVRRAFAHSLDKEVIANEIMDGAGFPATGGFLPPGLPAHSEGIGLPYAPDQARKQFREGWSISKGEFPPVEGLCPPRAAERIVEYCQAQWREILGIDIHWRTVSWPEYLRRLRESPPNVHGLVWLADYPDPDSFLRTSTWRSQTGWRNESYESLVRDARSVSDPGRRMDMYRQAECILVQETPIIPFLYGRQQYLAKPWLRIAPVLMPGVVPNLEDVIIEPH